MSVKAIIKERQQFTDMLSDVTGLLISEWNRRNTSDIVEVKIKPVYETFNNGKTVLVSMDVKTEIRL